MKKILSSVWDFFYKDFWTKIVLIAFTTILSFFAWEGSAFLFLFLYLIGFMFIKKPEE